jgi:hypothetical protein
MTKHNSGPRGLWFPGVALLDRLRGKAPPRFDPAKPRIMFQAIQRSVSWEGSPEAHVQGACGTFCRPDLNRHEELRDDGFVWGGAYFATVADARMNQAFMRWYDNGGREVVEAGRPVLADPQYEEGADPPAPRFEFVISEHLSEMTPKEIEQYYSIGEIPARLRRRGSNRGPRRR